MGASLVVPLNSTREDQATPTSIWLVCSRGLPLWFKYRLHLQKCKVVVYETIAYGGFWLLWHRLNHQAIVVEC
jgi:hypothetical protein